MLRETIVVVEREITVEVTDAAGTINELLQTRVPTENVQPSSTVAPTNDPLPASTTRPTSTSQPAGTVQPASNANTTTASPTAAQTNLTPIPDGDLATVTYIVDGDTIDVDLAGTTYRIRYIGMDTPERGDYFFNEATEVNRRLVEGQQVILVKDVSETDRYGRLLRYIYLLDGTFVNAELVRQGYAVIATFPPTNVPAPTSAPAPTDVPPPPPTAVPTPTNVPQATAPANCDPAYPTVCIPPPPPDLDCGEIPYWNFTVLPLDPHRFDGDNDGIGCES